MKSNIFFISVAALVMSPTLAQAQSAAPAPVDQAAPPAADQSAPATAAPADPAAATSAAPGTAPVATASADGVTKEGGKYMKDGRKATKTEIAEFKKAGKAKPE